MRRPQARTAAHAEIVWVATVRWEPQFREKYFQATGQTKSDRAQIRVRLQSNQPQSKHYFAL